MVKKSYLCNLIVICTFLFFGSIRNSNAAKPSKHIVIYPFSFKQVVFFGDSLTDQGNNTWIPVGGGLTKKYRLQNNGSPMTNKPFTNDVGTKYGKTWAQFLSESLFLKKASLPYHTLGDKSIINFAWASSETGDEYTNDLNTENVFQKVTSKCQAPGHDAYKSYACTPGLLKQINLYLNLLSSDNSYPKISKDTMIFIYAGANDIYDGLMKMRHKFIFTLHKLNVKKINAETKAHYKNDLPSNISIFHPIKSIINQPINNIIKSVKLLVKHGVDPRNIVLIDLPDMTQLPAFKKITHSNLAKKLVKIVINHFNSNLSEKLAQTGFEQIHILSSYHFLNDIMTMKDSHLGFTNYDSSCLYHPNNLEQCKGYVFFDDMHPTVKIHQLLAKSFKRCLLAWFPKRFENIAQDVITQFGEPKACSL